MIQSMYPCNHLNKPDFTCVFFESLPCFNGCIKMFFDNNCSFLLRTILSILCYDFYAT